MEKIKDAIRNSLHDIVNNSFLHCHIKNLHSLLLYTDLNGNKVRMYITDPNCELINNSYNKTKGKNLLISIHNHRTDITIKVIKGTLVNYNFKETSSNHGITFNIDSYMYTSPILDNTKRKVKTFIKIGDTKLKMLSKKDLVEGDELFISGETLHTVSNSDQITAWIIKEGDINMSYDPICYNNIDPNTLVDDTLYQKPRMKDVCRLLLAAFGDKIEDDLNHFMINNLYK